MSPATKISTRLLLFRRLLRLLFVMVLVFLPSWFCYKLWNSPYMRIWNVEIEGSERVSHTAIHHLSNLHYGTHFSDIQEGNTEILLETHPWIQNAQVEWDFPSTMRITVQEEKTHAL